MTYQEQLQAQQLNKQLIEAVLNKYSAEEVNGYYLEHTRAESLQYFGLRTEKQLLKLLKITGYNFSQVKPTTKRVNNPEYKRSHESYLAGGKKSAVTQKQHWQEKTDTERQDWANKMSECHLNSMTFKSKITKSNQEYRASLSHEEAEQQNKLRSQTMKSYWQSLSDEDRALLATRSNFKTYNCSNSGPNLAFAQLLTANNIAFEREFTLERKRFDFKVGNTLIEIDPAFTHNSTFTPFEYNTPLDKRYHQNKSLLAEKYGYRCIHVFDWDNPDKIISLLKDDRQSIAARKCQVKLVDLQEAKDFINRYHLQGYAIASIRYGLYYNNRLVSIMTFNKPRYNKKYEYELIRYCAKCKIIGGAEKLLKHFILDYKPKNIISYCDLSKFSGATYIKLGFSQLKKPSPSKHYYNCKTKEHFTDSLVRKQGFSRLVHHCDAKDDANVITQDNKTLFIEAGFVEVYDCGQAAYALALSTDN